MNSIWLFMIVSSLATASFSGSMEEMSKAIFDSAKNAVTLAISLIGTMCLWLGVVKVAERGGLMSIIGQWLKPIMTRLFPDIPAGHPAMSAMIMNFAANILGLGNAATPLGIKAMQELDKLNPIKGTASNAMCYFLAINTSGLAIFPLGIIAVRAAAGSHQPAAIFLPTVLTTACSTTVALLVGWIFYRRSADGMSQFPSSTSEASSSSFVSSEGPGLPPLHANFSQPGRFGCYLFSGLIGIFAAGLVLSLARTNATSGGAAAFGKEFLSFWFVSIFMCSMLLFGYFRGVNVYEAAVEGAQEGFNTAVRIIPYLVAILVAIGMFRASGAFDVFLALTKSLTTLIGLPSEALPIALLRPLSGTGAFGVTVDIINRHPNDFLGFLASTMYGGSDTTFYIIAIYFGSVGVKKIRWALPAGLAADAAAIIAAVLICRMFAHL